MHFMLWPQRLFFQRIKRSMSTNATCKRTESSFGGYFDSLLTFLHLFWSRSEEQLDNCVPFR